MSDGLNKAFRQAMRGDLAGNANPQSFLQTNLFATQPHQSLGVKSGVQDINLVRVGGLITVQLATKGGTFSHAFPAYICPNVLKSSQTVTLGSDADFFFTPALTGCILEINGAAVTHHDGLVKPYPPASLNGVQRGGGGGRRQWDRGDYHASIVVGVRSSKGWSFYQQSYDFNHKAPLGTNQVSSI